MAAGSGQQLPRGQPASLPSTQPSNAHSPSAKLAVEKKPSEKKPKKVAASVQEAVRTRLYACACVQECLNVYSSYERGRLASMEQRDTAFQHSDK